ncbi:hypothetical protein [Streptomyces violascens]|uniref:Uncharacterized protein n=1 Tax=Streptomyces violascens TaxID=67381 RepID=A0ABQ3QLL7_9ACTN|nr:hypothetical protein [Streptomyces violascens]GGU36283.1 hypothetical protein GCM10010289_66670 [Streptomyces violascens]GHI38166.1 hypothetical protein Sviol_25740 [Streptomyces violascens]
MPTAIAVTSPDLVLPPTDPQTPLAALLQSPHAQPLDAALVDMHRLLEQHGYVIAFYPASIDAAHEHRLHTVRSLLETDRITLIKSDLPPLGLAILVRQLRQLSVCDFSPGVIASAARLLSHYIHAGAVLNSVTRLERIPVGLTAHAKSWMPGSQFAVLAHPDPQLVKVGPAGALTGPDFACHLLLAKGTANADWITGTLAPSWQVKAVQETALPADSAGWWGTGKVTEFAAYLPDISVLYQLVASVRREQCRWCAMELIGDRCGFCASRQPPEEEPAAPYGAAALGPVPASAYRARPLTRAERRRAIAPGP